MKALQAKLDATIERCRDQRATISDLDAKCMTLNKERDELVKRCDQLTADLSVTTQSLTISKGSAHGVVNECHARGERIKVLTYELSRKITMIDTLNKANSEQAATIEKLNHHVRVLQACESGVSGSSHSETVAKLIAAFESALMIKPHLWFEVGYTRPTDWMVHIWDKSRPTSEGQKIIETQGSIEAACNHAKVKLEDYIFKPAS